MRKKQKNAKVKNKGMGKPLGQILCDILQYDKLDVSQFKEYLNQRQYQFLVHYQFFNLLCVVKCPLLKILQESMANSNITLIQFGSLTNSKKNMKAENQIILNGSLQNNSTANALKKYLSCLGPSSGYFSILLYSKNDKFYFLTKDCSFPYIPFDWTMYTLMRIKAKTIITSGPTMRTEKPIYGESRGTFGKEELHKLYEDNTHQPFNLLVYTSSMKDQEIKQIVCDKYFKYIPFKQLGPVKDNFKDIAEKVNQLKMGPTIYENGKASLGKAMEEVKQNENNFVEMVVLSVYEGAMPEKFIGDEYNTKIISRDFEKVWESETVASTAKHDDGQEKPITLKYIVYLRKDKANNNKKN